MNKTPATVLQELCVKCKTSVPVYELTRDGSINSDKIFTFQVFAFNMTIEGCGRSKKDAKHDAATKMIELLQRTNHESCNEVDDVEMQCMMQSADSNAVGELLDICVQRDMPLPVFRILNAGGPSHAPEFTVECVVASIVRSATHSTKKGAKQRVAQKMLEILQNMSYNCNQMQVATLNATLANDEADKKLIVKTYLELKNCNQTPLYEGVKLNQRFKHFSTTPDDIKERIKVIFYDMAYSTEEKVRLLLEALDIKYNVLPAPSVTNQDKLFFEAKGDQDVAIIAPADRIYAEVLSYFWLMIF